MHDFCTATAADDNFNKSCFHSSIKQFLTDLCELAVIYNYKLDIYGSIHVLADGLEFSNLLLNEHLEKQKENKQSLINNKVSNNKTNIMHTSNMNNNDNLHNSNITDDSSHSLMNESCQSKLSDSIKQINSFSKLLYQKNGCLKKKNRRKHLEVVNKMLIADLESKEETVYNDDENNFLIENDAQPTEKVLQTHHKSTMDEEEEHLIDPNISLSNIQQSAGDNNSSQNVITDIIKSYLINMGESSEITKDDQIESNIYSCSICNAQLNSVESFEIHMKFHSLLIKSEDILESLSNNSNYLSGININSSFYSSIFSNFTNDVIAKCNDHESYNEMFSIKENNFVNTNEFKSYEKLFKRLNCSTCNLSFRTMDGLKCHINSKHSLRKTYKCQFCPKVFLTRQASYSHRVKIHSSSINTKNVKNI
ncbi:hypothetical protein HELRODRAFT_175014 [Helobdella robusta]|uniref:C2H2-type domain-containing protein n=1 Tax=Helobdella robusta TaxID=6412 RepID=T1F8Q4_HELRO|nr:hypothetical protein HELRODRAFT_175014 [Helobdella robusta]ESO01456.1 hypothetical protein HELRODRAFT_175014 [Helobdella robusta]